MGPKIVRHILLWQTGIAVTASAIAFLFANVDAGLSVGSGGLIACLPNWLAARVLFARRDADPQRLTMAVYRAEIRKFIATVVLFAAVFILYKGVLPLYLFGAYIVTYLVQWLLPVWLARKK